MPLLNGEESCSGENILPGLAGAFLFKYYFFLSLVFGSSFTFEYLFCSSSLANLEELGGLCFFLASLPPSIALWTRLDQLSSLSGCIEKVLCMFFSEVVLSLILRIF